MNTKNWHKMNKIVGIILYTVFIYMLILLPLYLGWLFLALVSVVPAYVGFYVNHLRVMEKESVMNNEKK